MFAEHENEFTSNYVSKWKGIYNGLGLNGQQS